MENKYIIENPKEFILGGKAEFTLENIITHNHLTFSINKCNDKQMYFVSVCNTYDGYMFIGCLYTNKELTEFSFVKSKKLDADKEQLSIKSFMFIKHNYLENFTPFAEMKFYHHGNCCVCGRKLTTPDSIIRGIGPFCASRS